jgi:hypothetical protein
MQIAPGAITLRLRAPMARLRQLEHPRPNLIG